LFAPRKSTDEGKQLIGGDMIDDSPAFREDNPKAGGSSLHTVFESHFRIGKQCPIVENDKVGHEGLRGTLFDARAKIKERNGYS
jgi:hypothetical protein